VGLLLGSVGQTHVLHIRLLQQAIGTGPHPLQDLIGG